MLVTRECDEERECGAAMATSSKGHRQRAVREMRMLRSRGVGRSRIYLLWQRLWGEKRSTETEAATNKLALRRQPRSRAQSSRNPLTCEHPNFTAKAPGPRPEARPPKLQSAPPHWPSANLAKKPLRESSEKWGYIGPRSTPASKLLFETPTGSGIQSNARDGRCKGNSPSFIETYVSPKVSPPLRFPTAPDF
jgi:hypothetical protein